MDNPNKPLAEAIENFIGLWALCNSVGNREKEATESLARLGHALKQILSDLSWTPPTDEEIQGIIEQGKLGVL